MTIKKKTILKRLVDALGFMLVGAIHESPAFKKHTTQKRTVEDACPYRVCGILKR